jgi:hypothetical protein
VLASAAAFQATVEAKHLANGQPSIDTLAGVGCSQAEG